MLSTGVHWDEETSEAVNDSSTQSCIAYNLYIYIFLKNRGIEKNLFWGGGI